jgi:hypothetical protein
MIRRLALFALAALLAAPLALAQNQIGGGGGGVTGTSGIIPNNYIPTYWYIPWGQSLGAAGLAPGAGSIRCIPGFFTRTLTTSNIGLRIQTLFAGGNIQAAIYANSAATNQPTGTPLVTTASMSTAAVAFVQSPAVVQLQAGAIYWFCSNMDNATAIAVSAVNTSHGTANLVGSLGFNGALNQNGGGITGWTTPVTFGTWGDLSGAVWTIATTSSYPLLSLQIGSVP